MRTNLDSLALGLPRNLWTLYVWTMLMHKSLGARIGGEESSSSTGFYLESQVKVRADCAYERLFNYLLFLR
jgi:hypothetical protein